MLEVRSQTTVGRSVLWFSAGFKNKSFSSPHSCTCTKKVSSWTSKENSWEREKTNKIARSKISSGVRMVFQSRVLPTAASCCVWMSPPTQLRGTRPARWGWLGWGGTLCSAHRPMPFPQNKSGGCSTLCQRRLVWRGHHWWQVQDKKTWRSQVLVEEVKECYFAMINRKNGRCFSWLQTSVAANINQFLQ